MTLWCTLPVSSEQELASQIGPDSSLIEYFVLTVEGDSVCRHVLFPDQGRSSVCLAGTPHVRSRLLGCLAGGHVEC